MNLDTSVCLRLSVKTAKQTDLREKSPCCRHQRSAGPSGSRKQEVDLNPTMTTLTAMLLNTGVGSFRRLDWPGMQEQLQLLTRNGWAGITVSGHYPHTYPTELC